MLPWVSVLFCNWSKRLWCDSIVAFICMSLMANGVACLCRRLFSIYWYISSWIKIQNFSALVLTHILHGRQELVHVQHNDCHFCTNSSYGPSIGHLCRIRFTNVCADRYLMVNSVTRERNEAECHLFLLTYSLSWPLWLLWWGSQDKCDCGRRCCRGLSLSLCCAGLFFSCGDRTHWGCMGTQ